MRLFILFILCPFILLAQPKDEMINKMDEKGKKQGVWKGFYPDTNVIRYEGQFKDDKPIGDFKYYYKTGETQTVLKYDKRNYAYSQSYYPNGVDLAKGRYLNQLKDSSWVYFNLKGQKISEEFYIEGKKYGLWKVYFNNKNLADSKNWENDIEQGEHKQYHLNGKLARVVNYVDGSIEGKSTTYHKNGQIEAEGIYRRDARQGTWKMFDENGKLLKEINYVNGVPKGGLPVVETGNKTKEYKKDILDESDFLPEDQYAPIEEKRKKKKK